MFTQDVQFEPAAAEMMHGLKDQGSTSLEIKVLCWMEDRIEASLSMHCMVHLGKDIRYGVLKNSRAWICMKDEK